MCGGRSLSQELRPSVLDRAASVACADHPSRLRARCRSRRVEFAYVPLRAQLAAPAPCITAPTQREPTRRSLERAPPSRERVVGLDRAASVACADRPSRRAPYRARRRAPGDISALGFRCSPLTTPAPSPLEGDAERAPSRERVVASTVRRPCRVRNGRASEKVTVSADVPGHESPQHDGVVRTSYICLFLRHRANSTGVDMALARATRSSERVVGPDRAASVACADVPSRLARAAVAAASSAPTSLRVPSSLQLLASPLQLNESRPDDHQSERRRAESESSVLIVPPPWRAPIICRAPRALT